MASPGRPHGELRYSRAAGREALVSLVSRRPSGRTRVCRCSQVVSSRTTTGLCSAGGILDDGASTSLGGETADDPVQDVDSQGPLDDGRQDLQPRPGRISWPGTMWSGAMRFLRAVSATCAGVGRMPWRSNIPPSVSPAWTVTRVSPRMGVVVRAMAMAMSWTSRIVVSPGVMVRPSAPSRGPLAASAEASPTGGAGELSGR